MKLEIELAVSEAEEPIQWIERLRAEIMRICDDNGLDPSAFVQESPE